MADLPSGTVTFLFTDIEGSTALWERDRAAMANAVQRHLHLLRSVIEAHGGVLFRAVRDAVQAAFPATSDAVVAPTAHPRSPPFSWPYRAYPRQRPFLVRRYSAGHPRGVLQRAPVPHRSSAAGSKRVLRSLVGATPFCFSSLATSASA